MEALGGSVEEYTELWYKIIGSSCNVLEALVEALGSSWKLLEALGIYVGAMEHVHMFVQNSA